jgi:prevent-host-death family protein
MIRSVGVSEAKATLSRLLVHVEAGDEVIITRHGVEIASLVSVHPPAARQFGLDRGLFVVPEDFNEPLTDGFA